MEKLVIQSSIDNLVDVESFVTAVCDSFNINNYAATISMSLIQAVTNAIVHGNKNDAKKQVVVVSDRCKGGIFFSVSDQGEGFDYSCFGSMPEKEERGTGLYIMNSLADKLSFSNNGSTVRLDFVINGIEASRALERVMTIRNYYATRTVNA